ncbi:MAG: Fur family transcriptional regulator [Pseudomonadota bacterium]
MAVGRPTQPRPCTDPTCSDLHEPAAQVALAASLCSARGAKLTTLRRQLLELLWESARPMGAYELIEALKIKTARQVGPPTVYRGLEFLIAQGLAVKIESRNTYTPCSHPERRHDSLFFICADCGAAAELDDQRIMRLLAEDAADLGYRVTKRVVEIQGTCGHCAAAADAR